MSPSEKCRSCGASIPVSGGAGGLCPSCLLELGLNPETPPSEGEATPSWTGATLESSLKGRIGPYKCMTALGAGGMGVVLLAEQTEPIRRRVAVKVVKRGMDSKEVIARFESERQALALMNHPGIAKVLDAGTTKQGQPYFVMEYVAGLPITEYCDRNHLSSRERVALLIRVCEAIQHAHTKGLVHRDVKPTNVLVCDEDGQPRPKIIDFGIAKALNQRLTEKTVFTSFGVMIGTPGYASPEQSDPTGVDVDTRSDIYSVGVLAYEVLVGCPPFDPQRLRNAGWAEMQRIIREEEPPRPSTLITTQGASATEVARRRRTDPTALASQLRGDLDWITLKALEKDRARRYQSASELAADLKRHLSDEPVSAGPPDLAYRFRKAVRRHRAAFAAGVTGLAAILAGLVVSTAFYLWAEHARRERQREVVRLDVATGMHLADEGDRMAALPWLVEALRLEDDARRRVIHRKRIAATLSHLPKLYRLWPHSGPVSRAVWRPDGEAVATAAVDGTVRVWSVASGEAIVPPIHHQGLVRDLQFSPDGGRLVGAGNDGAARVWDAATGRELLVLKHSGPVNRAVFSPDGRLVATASDDRTAVVWDAVAGTPISTVRHEGVVFWAEFSPDGDALFSSSTTGLITDVRSGRRRVGLLEDDNGVFRAAFSRDGSKLATMSYSAFRMWDATTGRPLTPPFRHWTVFGDGRLSSSGRWLLGLGQGDPGLPVWNAGSGERTPVSFGGDAPLTTAMFSEDERLVIAGDAGGGVHVWRSETGERAAPVLRHGGPASVAGFDPSGRLLLTYSEDGTARVWDLAPAALASDVVMRHEKALTASFAPDSHRIITTTFLDGGHGHTRIWDAESGDPVTPPLRHLLAVSQHSLSGDGRLLSTMSIDGTARVWDLTTGEPTTAPLGPVGALFDGRLTRDGRRLIGVDRHEANELLHDAEIRVWDVATGASLPLPVTRERHLVAVEFSPDGRVLVTLGADGHVRVWDAYSGTLRSEAFAHPVTKSEDVTAAVSPDGARVLLAFRDSGSYLAQPSGAGLSEFWDMRGSKVLAAPQGHVMAGRFSPSGGLLGVAGWGGDLRLCDGRTGGSIGSPMRHRGLVLNLDFDPDGDLLASSSGDGTARVWDAASGEPVTPWLVHGAAVTAVAFAPDGRRLVTSSWDNTTRVWALEEDGRPIEDLVALAQLLAGRRIVGATGALELTGDELSRSWQDLRRRYPESFAVSVLEVQSWHRAQAEDLSLEEHWHDAVTHFDAALTNGPKRWVLLVGRGRAHAELGDWEKAGRDFGEALAMLPGEVEAAHSVALVQLLRGQRDLLERTRETLVSRWATTRNPDRARWAAEAMIVAPIASAVARLQAVKWAETTLEIEPKRRERIALHGAALYRAGRFSQAVKVLERAMASDPASKSRSPRATFLAFLALANRALGRPAEAARWRAAALALLQELEHPAPPPDSVTGKPLISTVRAATWREREELRVLLREGGAPVGPTVRSAADLPAPDAGMRSR